MYAPLQHPVASRSRFTSRLQTRQPGAPRRTPCASCVHTNYEMCSPGLLLTSTFRSTGDKLPHSSNAKQQKSIGSHIESISSSGRRGAKGFVVHATATVTHFAGFLSTFLTAS